MKNKNAYSENFREHQKQEKVQYAGLNFDSVESLLRRFARGEQWWIHTKDEYSGVFFKGSKRARAILDVYQTGWDDHAYWSMG